MKKLMIALVLMFATTMTASAERKELHILSGNDMHAAIECFPRLGFIADSLRALYPDLLILSAGDNRSGDPLNDMYEIPAYPMVVLMNQVGFNATTLGNHEFDSAQDGLARLIDLSAFPTLCANVHPDPKWNMHLQPYTKFYKNGLTIGVIGVVQLGSMGVPESHPARMTDISFTDPLETIKQYEFLRKECDVVILLSHLGYETDVEFSKDLPWVDLIIGGHTHTQLNGGEMHNNVFITQNVNRLKQITHTTVVVEDGQVVSRTAENIAVRGEKNENKVIAELVRFFSENPAFHRVLATAATPFDAKEELGCLMVDAYVAEGNAELSYQNAGGVRYETHEAGDFTVADVLRLDPFQNDAVELHVTGKELAEMLIACYDNDNQRFPYVGGMTAEYTVDPATLKIKKLVLYGKDGKKLNMKKIYKVISNSYSVAVSPTNRQDPGESLGIITAKLIMDYLEHQGQVSYKGRTCLKEIK